MKLVLLYFTIISILKLTEAQYSNEDEPEDRRRKNKNRPCVFKYRPKNEGRTFLDWNYHFVDVSYNYNYNIDCSVGNGGFAKPQRPQRPQRPPRPPRPTRPPRPDRPNGGFGSILGNIPQLPQYTGGGSQSQSQSQSQFSQSGVLDETSQLIPQRPILNGVGTLIGSIPNSPVAQGIGSIGQGFGSILGLIPQTFQSLSQSISFPSFPSLPVQNAPSSTGGFFPQGIFSNWFNRPAGTPAAAPETTTPDTIYNDEMGPVNTNYDPVLPDAYSNLPPGKPRPNYNNNYYNKLPYYTRYRGY